MSGKLIFFGFLLTLFIAGVYFDAVELEDKKLKMKEFDGYSVNGVIKDVRYNHRVIDMRLAGDTTQYVFRVDDQYSDDQKYIFEVTAQVGDRVVKPAYSDTIRLIKRSKTFYYSFWTPSQK